VVPLEGSSLRDPNCKVLDPEHFLTAPALKTRIDGELQCALLWIKMIDIVIVLALYLQVEEAVHLLDRRVEVNSVFLLIVMLSLWGLCKEVQAVESGLKQGQLRLGDPES